jgi:hypothetical protein
MKNIFKKVLFLVVLFPAQGADLSSRGNTSDAVTAVMCIKTGKEQCIGIRVQ